MNLDELLTRAVDRIYPTKEDLEELLKKDKKLRVYQGFDPTGQNLHIGHMIGLRKLKQWQDLGHKVIFLIGDFTALVGDPSGKSESRKMLNKKDVLQNAKTYKEQAGKILNFSGDNPAEVRFNSEWLAKMSGLEFIKISSLLSLQQVIERDLFQERLKSGQDLFMNEFFYPVMQAYDSVAMDIDVEIGGVDQTFNMLMGRKLIRHMLKKDKFVMTTPLLTDSSGQKIGKTEGNVIAMIDRPSELYRRIMALGDDVIVKGLEYLTDVPINEIGEIEQKIKSGENPIKFKKKLAFEVTKQLNSEDDAKKAEEEFERVVQKGEPPQDILEIDIKGDDIIDENLLVKHSLADSKSDAKRLFEQNAVRIDGQKISTGQKVENGILNVGRKLVKLNLKN